MGYIEKTQHPFNPRFDGAGCRQYVDVVDHRTIECGKAKADEIHDGTRPEVPELEHRLPLCPLCGAETDHDGESICCEPCGAYWPSNNGPGAWEDPTLKVCTSAFKPFDRDDLAPEHENIRHQVRHCLLPLDHEGRTHRSDEFTVWTDSQALA